MGLLSISLFHSTNLYKIGACIDAMEYIVVSKILISEKLIFLTARCRFHNLDLSGLHQRKAPCVVSRDDNSWE